MTAQVLVIAVGVVSLVVTAVLVAPGLFREHLARSGAISADVQHHAEQAFATAFLVALTFATAASLVAAGLVSWFLVRRVARPVEQLAAAAEAVAGGRYTVRVPDTSFSSELAQLTDSFAHMANRLSATETTRSRLLSDLAHELRTPVATLEAYIDGLEDGVLPADGGSWATMRDQVDRLRRLAGDLREVAAAEEHALGLRLVPVDARTVAAAAVAAAGPRYLAKGVDLALAEPTTAVRILGDAVRLQQVLANLLDNALRHTAPGGHVWVNLTAGAGLVTMHVRDDGDGIPLGQLDTIFDRFHRVDPARASTDGSGSGLGLTIARAIVADHNGTLSAHSDGPGSGASLTLTLPTAAPS